MECNVSASDEWPWGVRSLIVPAGGMDPYDCGILGSMVTPQPEAQRNDRELPHAKASHDADRV